MKIDEMPAGREMDKAISQYVFGNKEFVCRHSDDDYHVVNEQNGLIAYLYVPHYSINIAAAWAVWEWLKRRTHEINFTWCKGIYYFATFDGYGNLFFGTDAETFPLAVCRIALKALGVEEA